MKEFDEGLTKRFECTYTFCDKDIDIFCLMFRKVVYSHKYINS